MTTDEFAAKSGLSPRQLQFWDENGALTPGRGLRSDGRGAARIYSARDLIRALTLRRMVQQGMRVGRAARLIEGIELRPNHCLVFTWERAWQEHGSAVLSRLLEGPRRFVVMVG